MGRKEEGRERRRNMKTKGGRGKVDGKGEKKEEDEGNRSKGGRIE